MASSSGSSGSKSRRRASSRSNPRPPASSSSRPPQPPPASSSSRPPQPPASSSSRPQPPPRWASSSSKRPPMFPLEEIIVEGIANTCWEKFNKDARFALYTPFIVCVASGTLEVETLRQCIAQDVHFLKPFDQAFELAEEYAVDDDDRREVIKVRKLAKKKLNLHDYYVQEWGSDVEATPIPATSKCIDFLLATSLGKIDGVKPLSRGFTGYEKTKLAAYILAAISACITLNGYIGKEAQGIISEPHKWIQNYSSNSFQALCSDAETLLDTLSVALTLDELAVVQRVYSQAIKLEIDYFLAQPLIQKAIVPLSGEHNLEERRLMIFSNFDLTCTEASSSASLADLSILTAKVSEKQQISTETQIARISSSDLKKSWDVIGQKYRNGFKQCIEKLLAHRKAAKKFNYEGLRKALEKVSDFEREENLKVIESGHLKGLQLKHIKFAGEVVKLQDGCMNFFQTIKKKNASAVDVYVLSYSWSGYFIRAVFTKGEVDDVKVHANDLEFEESLSTGGIMIKVQSPIDKVEAFEKIIVESSGEGNDKKKLLSVYIGGKVGDLLCLLKADVGIVLGSNGNLRNVAERFGVKFVPLFTGVVKKQRECVKEMEGSSFSSTWKGMSGILYTASSWAEIHAFVIGS